MPLRFFLLVLALFFAAAPARADDIDAARAKFADGVRLYRSGDFEGARAAFLEAERAHHAAVTTYNLALVEERLLHMQAAVNDYDRYLAEAGDAGEFSEVAAVAVAQLRRRSARIRIETTPPGAHVFIDASPVDEVAPTTVLVSAGRHHVAVEWPEGRAASDVDILASELQTVRLDRPAGVDVPSPRDGTAPSPVQTSSAPQGVAADASNAALAKEPKPEGIVFGGDVVFIPFYFFASVDGGPKATTQIGGLTGFSAEVGYAFTERAIVTLKAEGAIGTSCKDILGAHLAGVGPHFTYRATHSLWLGVGSLAGHTEACRDAAVLSSDLIFSPSIDVSYAATTTSYGQWLFSLGVGYVFANVKSDNSMVYAPLGFGPRVF